MYGTPVLSEGGDVFSGRDVQSVEERGALTLEMMIGLHTVTWLVLDTCGINLIAAWTDDEAVGLGAGQCSADSSKLGQIETCVMRQN